MGAELNKASEIKSAKSNRSGSREPLTRLDQKEFGGGQEEYDGHDVSSIDTDQKSNQKHIPKSMPSLTRGGGGSKAKKSQSKGKKRAPPIKILGAPAQGSDTARSKD